MDQAIDEFWIKLERALVAGNGFDHSFLRLQRDAETKVAPWRTGFHGGQLAQPHLCASEVTHVETSHAHLRQPIRLACAQPFRTQKLFPRLAETTPCEQCRRACQQ